ncbi:MULTISPECIES: hypothetical protein [Paenibacillus]|uniref:Uncharacterized protein n=1 Tax=Paenibacillus radicis (ex Xue et al. 2023) TaxID=2972489 RepID=A0ABT1YD84_9BACL|nr:hypothetical protein [Paenibacillus radicis (ex Xue et al. 2023)]MCR8631147.1 hypothetical protein [Paenibacillus radicis (ex Xue et al. 2023)]
MKLILAIVGGSIGLLVTASAVFMAWALYQHHKTKSTQDIVTAEPSDKAGITSVSAVSAAMLRWTFFDYALIAVFAVGSLFLFTDVIAVIRDAESYPLYHYGYLICGFVFTLFGMLFMILRLAFVLSLVRADRPLTIPDNHNQPSDADQAE